MIFANNKHLLQGRSVINAYNLLLLHIITIQCIPTSSIIYGFFQKYPYIFLTIPLGLRLIYDCLS